MAEWQADLLQIYALFPDFVYCGAIKAQCLEIAVHYVVHLTCISFKGIQSVCLGGEVKI